MKLVNCKNCGHPVEMYDHYCSQCGAPVKVIPVSLTEEPVKEKLLIKKDKEPKAPLTIKQYEFMQLIGGLFSALGVMAGVMGVIIYIGSKNITNIYLSTNISFTSEEDSNTSSTVIKYDNNYNYIAINSKEDAIKKIKEDNIKNNKKCFARSTVKNIEKKITKDYGVIAVSLCEINDDVAEDIEEVFDKVFIEFPTTKGYLTNLTIVNDEAKQNFVAAFQPFFQFLNAKATANYPQVIKTQLLLNSAYFLIPDELNALVDTVSDTGYFPKNASGLSLVAHELGHYLSFVALLKYKEIDSLLMIKNSQKDEFMALTEESFNGTYSLSLLEEAYNKFLTTENSDIPFDLWRSTISSYAVVTDSYGAYIYDETIAEAFHDYYVNGDEAATASQYIMDVLREKVS